MSECAFSALVFGLAEQNGLSKRGLADQAGLLDAELSKNNDGYQGNIFPSVPEQTASLLLNYQPNLAWDATLGADHQGKCAGDLANSFLLRVIRAMMRHWPGRLTRIGAHD